MQSLMDRQDSVKSVADEETQNQLQEYRDQLTQLTNTRETR